MYILLLFYYLFSRQVPVGFAPKTYTAISYTLVLLFFFLLLVMDWTGCKSKFPNPAALSNGWYFTILKYTLGSEHHRMPFQNVHHPQMFIACSCWRDLQTQIYRRICRSETGPVYAGTGLPEHHISRKIRVRVQYATLIIWHIHSINQPNNQPTNQQ